MTSQRPLLIALLLTLATQVSMAQKVLSLNEKAATGATTTTRYSQTDTTELPGDPLVFNVAEPSLIYYPARPASPNSMSLIVCPGGGFYYEHIKTEGADVAKWLNAKGIAVFVLQYHLVHCETFLPLKERDEKRKDTAGFARLAAAVIPQAIDDARQAVAYVRKHAAEYNLSPDRIGIMGFSAGGTLAVASAFDNNAANKPNFIAPIYPFVPQTLNTTATKETPPAFIAAASDDEYHLVPHSLDLYNKWLKAGRPVELHIYSKGGHGFGMNKNKFPADTWIDRFYDWVQIQGL